MIAVKIDDVLCENPKASAEERNTVSNGWQVWRKSDILGRNVVKVPVAESVVNCRNRGKSLDWLTKQVASISECLCRAK